MRFSNVFQLSALQRSAAAAEPARAEPAPAIETTPSVAAPARELPDDLDQRVRLVGEWQLGEGY